MMRAMSLSVLVLDLSVGLADIANTKDKPGKAKGHGNSQKSNPGKGSIPPGQIKRYTLGAKLPSDLVC